MLVSAAGDAAYRYQYVDASDDLGLRGGTEHYTTNAAGDVITAHLHGVRWTTDTTIDGSLVSDYFGLGVDGRLTVRDSSGHRLTGAVTWQTTGPHTVATVTTDRATYLVPAT